LIREHFFIHFHFIQSQSLSINSALSKSQFHLSFIARQFICCRVKFRCTDHINLHFDLKNQPILNFFVDSGIKQTRFDPKNVYCFVQRSTIIKTQPHEFKSLLMFAESSQ